MGGEIRDNRLGDISVDPLGTTGLCRLSAGVAGYVLTSNGPDTIPSYQAPSGGGGGALVLVEQHTASSSSELDFTSGITSTYDEYVIDIVNLTPATNNTDMCLQFSTNGGSSYDNTSGHYSWGSFRFVYASGGFGNTGAPSDSKIVLTIGLGLNSNAAADGGLCGSWKLFNPLSGSRVTKITGQSNALATSGFSDVGNMTAASYLVTTAANAFRIYSSSGNLTSGTVRLYGIAH